MRAEVRKRPSRVTNQEFTQSLEQLTGPVEGLWIGGNLRTFRGRYELLDCYPPGM